MSKKLMFVISILLIAAFALAACQPAATETPAPGGEVQPTTAVEQPTQAEEPEVTEPTEVTEPEPSGEVTTITLWHQWTGDYLNAITQAFRDYEADHPGVVIDLSTPEAVADALNVAIPAGEGPDIIGWANDKIGEQALVGNIVPLDEYGIDRAFLEANYADAAVNGVIWMDQVWALPETMEGIALVANTDVVTEEYMPADPMDFEDLLAKAQAFKEANPDKVLICNQGWGASDAYHVAPIYFGFGLPSYVDEEGNTFFNTPEALAAAQWLKDMSAVSLAEASHDICNAALSEGRAGFWWTGPWAISGLEQAGVNYEVVQMGRPFVGIKTLMLSANAVDRGNAEIAVDIMKYFTSAEVQKELALVNKTIPAATAALEDPEVTALPAVSGFGAAIAEGVPMSPSPLSSAQWDPVGRASAAIWTGVQEPEAAVGEIQTAIETAVAGMQ